MVPPLPTPAASLSTPEPVLKWAGGKRRLIEQYRSHLPLRFKNYHEPFFGGGALYFWLQHRGKLQGRRAYLTDVNSELINFYQVLQASPVEFHQLLAQHALHHGTDHYYHVRGQNRNDLNCIERAARLLYLNRTCFNGLYRENSKGEFNVPIGRYKNPRIYHLQGLQAASLSLQGSDLDVCSYLDVQQRAQPGDLVYFDPPYHPLTPTSSFTSYTQHNFNEADQVRLAGLFRDLKARKVKVLLSNSDTPLIRDLYKGLKIVEIQAGRAINSRADRRQKITELLIIG